MFFLIYELSTNRQRWRNCAKLNFTQILTSESISIWSIQRHIFDLRMQKYIQMTMLYFKKMTLKAKVTPKGIRFNFCASRLSQKWKLSLAYIEVLVNYISIKMRSWTTIMMTISGSYWKFQKFLEKTFWEIAGFEVVTTFLIDNTHMVTTDNPPENF